MQLGPAEILVVLVIALLVFGPTRLPEVGRQVGRAVRELRRFQQTIRRDVGEVFDVDDDRVDATRAAEPPPTLPPKPRQQPPTQPESTQRDPVGSGPAMDTTSGSPPDAVGESPPANGDEPKDTGT